MDYMARICMIILCVSNHTLMCGLTINSKQCECLAISVYVWQSEYVREYVQHTKQFFVFLLLLKLFLLYFLMGQINHLYDV